ncbi:unnamed protein product, partial [Rhizoctonia solani]
MRKPDSDYAISCGLTKINRETQLSSSWHLPSLRPARVNLPYPNSKMPESYIAEERLPQHSTHFYSTGDIILQAHTVLFRVHKDVLCQHSEVFKDIFELAEPENAEDPPATPSDADPRIVIYDNPDELALLLDFLYGNYINYENTKRCLRLTLLAHKYDISTLVEICCNHVICQLPIDSTAEAHETVSKYRDDPTLIPLALRVARLVEVPELLPWVLYMLSVQSDADYHLSTQSEEDRLLVQSYAGVTQKIRDMHPTIAEWWDEV